ncbi:MAG TPA: MFS transporter [Kineosporiaceae bacterium]|nr:MFS transporter [Kineosporiaceae bacterium]
MSARGGGDRRERLPDSSPRPDPSPRPDDPSPHTRRHGPGGDEPETPATPVSPWWAMSVCFAALFVTLLDITVVNVALPSIARGTGAVASQLQWVVSGYALAFGLVPVLAGRIGDQYGRRPVLIAGVAGFVLTSAMVGLAPNPAVLLAGRFLQGLAGGVINPQVAGLIQELFPGKRRGRAFGALGTVVGVAGALGPVVGGLVIALGGDRLGWRLVFFVNIPVGLLALLLARRWLPAPHRSAGPPARLDLLGAGLLGSAVLSVMLAAIEYGSSRQADRALIALPAPVLAWLFVRWERRLAERGGQPLVDLRLFRIRSYAIGVMVALAFFCGSSGLPLVLSLYFQDGLGYSALQSGLSVTALAVGSALAATISGRLVHRYGRLVTLTALGLFAAGIVAAGLSVHLAARAWAVGGGVGLALSPALFLAGMGNGGVITPNQALSLAEVDVRGGGTAAGMLQTSQRIGAAVGTAVVGAVFFAALGGQHDPAAGGASGTQQAAARAAFTTALDRGLLVILGFVLSALLLALAEISRRAARPPGTGWASARPPRRDGPAWPRMRGAAGIPRRSAARRPARSG